MLCLVVAPCDRSKAKAKAEIVGRLVVGGGSKKEGLPARRPKTLLFAQCEREDSNLHAHWALDPKSSASANSATLAKRKSPR